MDLKEIKARCETILTGYASWSTREAAEETASLVTEIERLEGENDRLRDPGKVLVGRILKLEKYAEEVEEEVKGLRASEELARAMSERLKAGIRGLMESFSDHPAVMVELKKLEDDEGNPFLGIDPDSGKEITVTFRWSRDKGVELVEEER